MRWHVQSEECMCTVRALLSKSKLCGGVSSPLPLLFLVARPPDPGTLSLWCVCRGVNTTTPYTIECV